MEEKRLDELLNEESDSNIEEMRQLEKTVSKRMNEKITRRSLVVSLAVALVIGLCIFGVQQFHDYRMDKDAFHMDEWENLLRDVSYSEWIQEKKDELNAYVYATAHTALTYPGMVLSKDNVSFAGIEKLDYSIYQFRGNFVDLFDVSALGKVEKDSETNVQISYSDIVFPFEYAKNETMFQSYPGVWFSLGDITMNDEQLLMMLEEVQRVPKSSILELDVMLNESITVEQLLEYQRSHEDSRVVYAVTHFSSRSAEVDEFEYGPYGFNLYEGSTLWVDLSYETKQNYPSLLLQNYMMPDVSESFWRFLPDYPAEELINHYVSCMKLLVNNNAASWHHNDYVKILADIEENGVVVRGFRIYATQEDALELFENENVRSVVIQDVKLSKYQK